MFKLIDGQRYIWRGQSGRKDLEVTFVRLMPSGYAHVRLDQAVNPDRYVRVEDLYPTGKPLPPRYPQTMPVENLLRRYKDGDELGWEQTFAWLVENRSERIVWLMGEVSRDGMTSPVSLGPDGRVWDGHHRLLVARILGLRRVPVTFE